MAQAILYARFSPRPNADECESCESQTKEMWLWCHVNRHTVVGEFEDRALSGGDDWKDRPGMLAAASAAKRGQIFVVRSYDRLFRDVEKALVFRSMLERQGVEVRSTTEDCANGDTPIAKMIRSVLLTIAEFQREQTRALTKLRMQQYQREGRRMSANVPWGWKKDPDNPARMLPDEEEIRTAEVIRELWDEGNGYRAIARFLDESGIRRRGKDWHHEMVRRILGTMRARAAG